ncbi:hypothetical protein LINPERHAP2_LOCUS2669 [Linum perenne]
MISRSGSIWISWIMRYRVKGKTL